MVRQQKPVVVRDKVAVREQNVVVKQGVSIVRKYG